MRESGIEQSAQKVIAEAICLREDIKILESSAESCEDDEASKDNQISTLREAHQEELFSKLQREKKDVGGNRQGTTEVSMILTLLVEQQDLHRQIEEMENSLSGLGKSKVSLTTRLADTKTLADAEARDRAALLTKLKSLRLRLRTSR